MLSKKRQLLKSVLSLLSVFSLSLLLVACGNSEDAQKVKNALDINTLNITSLEVSSLRSTIETTETEQFTAMAIISGGSEEPINVSSRVKWSSSDTANATINSTGLLSSKALESVTVTVNAQLADLSASKEIKLSDALLESINILNNPSPVSVCRGKYQLTAEGKYETGPGEEEDIRPITDKVTWTSGSPTLLEIDETGAFSTFKNGTAIVTASSNSIASTATITINDDIDGIAITTSSDTVNVGSTLSFTATGTYDDTSTAVITKNVSWVSDTPAALSISNDAGTKGVATGVTKDLANISATCLSTSAVVSNSVLINVEEPPVVNGVSINEDIVSLEFKIIDSPEQLVAKLKKSDGSFSTVVTDDDNTDWSIKRTISGTALTLSNTKGSKGEISFTAVGITEIEVRYDDNETGLGPFYDVIEVEVLAN
tara:strand:- start:28202 stop:29488 length:1287 start_codon:yes stop_codon:yes gene_type:complete